MPMYTRRHLVLLASIFYLLPLSTALTYWIHESCTEDKLSNPNGPPSTNSRWQLLINEAKESATNGLNRMRNGQDTQYARFFNYMFNVNRGQDTAIDYTRDPGRESKVKVSR